MKKTAEKEKLATILEGVEGGTKKTAGIQKEGMMMEEASENCI